MRNRVLGLLVIALCVLLGSAQEQGNEYAIAKPGYIYEFPRDYFDHPAFQTEWWYYTGNLRARDGHRFGFELTFFRQGVNRSASATSVWSVRDIYFAHLALSDLDGGKFYHTERINRAGPALAGASLEQKRVWNGNWEVRWVQDQQLLGAVCPAFSLEFSMRPAKPPIIHGQSGVSQKAEGAGHASHYVSLTRLTTSGTIHLGGESFAVTGSSWMDHEFFTNSLSADEAGWDWLSVQFENQTELMLYRLRHKDGSVDRFSSGTYVSQAGKALHLAQRDFQMTATGETWRSPSTGAIYPVAWDVAVPSLGMKFRVRTPLKSQEISGQAKEAPSYWEGAVEIGSASSGEGNNGVGYLELTGYDSPVPLTGRSR